MKRQRSSVGQNTETQGRASKVIVFMHYADSSGTQKGLHFAESYQGIAL